MYQIETRTVTDAGKWKPCSGLDFGLLENALHEVRSLRHHYRNPRGSFEDRVVMWKGGKKYIIDQEGVR